MRYLLIFVIAFLLFISKKYHDKRILYFSAIVLILYSTFRAYIPGAIVGNDYNSYNIWYNDISIKSALSLNNFLFNLLMITTKILFNNYDVFIFASSLLLIISVYYFSIKVIDDDRYDMAIFVFLSFGIYDLSMSAIRQWFAGSLFLISIKFIKERNFKKYAIFMIIASLFHNSAIVLLLVYPFINCNIDFRKKIKIMGFVTILMYCCLYFKLDIYIVSLIDKTYLIKYLNTKDGTLYANFTVFIISMLCFLIMIIQKNAYKKQIKNYNIDYNFMLLLVIISLMATRSALACRFQQYFMPALMMSIPGIIKTFDGVIKKIVFSCAIVFLMLIYIL